MSLGSQISAALFGCSHDLEQLGVEFFFELHIPILELDLAIYVHFDNREKKKYHQGQACILLD